MAKNKAMHKNNDDINQVHDDSRSEIGAVQADTIGKFSDTKDTSDVHILSLYSLTTQILVGLAR